MFRQMFNPDPYHGRLPWNRFEGWYFKVCSEEAVFAFIPGTFRGGSIADSHSFLQILNGVSTTYDYIRFPAENFKASQKNLEASISENRFSISGIRIKTETAAGWLEADLEFGNIVRWDNSARSHRSMGFYNFLPFMECYAQVCVMDMDIRGWINVDNKKYEFNKGRGYIEKTGAVSSQSHGFGSSATVLSMQELPSVPL